MGLKLKPKVYIDGDIILYSCGFASQRRWYKDSEGRAWPTITAAREGGVAKEELQCIIEPEPFSHAAHSANMLVQSIARKTTLEPVVVLSGPYNYRNDMATIFPYKGERSSERPVHYEELKEFLIDTFESIVTMGIEADDYLGAMCSDKGLEKHNENIMATLDKDLDMVPGTHYNWKSEEIYHIDHEKGMRNFFLQVLMGDKIDSIKSPKGIGPVKANRILDGTRAWYRASRMLYMNSITDGHIVPEMEACGVSLDELGEHWLHENMDLLWIRRTFDDEWKRHQMWFDESYYDKSKA